MVLDGHKSQIVATAISSTSKWAATAEGTTNDVRLWLFSQGKEGGLLKGPKSGTVRALAFSPDDQELAVACSTELFRWDLMRMEIVKTLKLTRLCPAIQYSPDGSMLAAAIGSDLVLLDRRTSKERYRFFAHEKGISRIAFSPDSKSIAAALADGSVTIWNLKDAPAPTHLKAHEFVISGLAFADNRLLCTGSWDGSVAIWDLQTLDKKTIAERNRDLVSALSVSIESNLLAFSTHEGHLRIWDLKLNREIV